MGGNEDDANFRSTVGEFALKIGTGHAGRTGVQDETPCLVRAVGR
jgi:hypothetical protein